MLVRNYNAAVDPTQRPRIAFDTYLPAVRSASHPINRAVRIVTSKSRFRAANIVSQVLCAGWRDYSR